MKLLAMSIVKSGNIVEARWPTVLRANPGSSL